jgi:O-antigen/teichoic acid export membrane protein
MATEQSTLNRRALSLGAANGIDYAIQFVLPAVLTRFLDAQAFGEYRLLWLAVSTVMAIAPMAMPQSLYFFLPRADAPTRRLYINQTFLFLVAGGLVGALLLSGLNPFLPPIMHAFVGRDPLVPVFIMLWVAASLLDLLPTVEERVRWQARVIVALSALRAIVLGVVAALTRDMGALVAALLLFTLLKLVLLLIYVGRHHGMRGPWLDPARFIEQFRHAAPFGVSGALHGLRGQADQWIAAAMFSTSLFAAFSIAAVLAPLVNLFRQSVNHVFLPQMSQYQAQGNIEAMVALNNTANLGVAALVFPLLAYCFAFAETLITLVYTGAYTAGAPVMRLYIVGLVAMVVELNSIMLLFRQGVYAMQVNLAVLLCSLPLSYAGAQAFGLPGAALGSVTTIYLERLATLHKISRISGISIALLQEWSRVGRLLLAAGAGATVAWWTVSALSVDDDAIMRLIAGGVVFLVSYAVALWALGCAGFLRNLMRGKTI